MERWTQSPCYRQFCEEEFFQHEFPIGPSQMARWRKRIGGAGCERPLTIGTTFIDHGYKSHGAPESSSRVLISGRKLGASLKRAPRRPSAIEPTFGHMKQDGLLGRNFLKGLWRDSQNVFLCGAVHNLRKILARLKLLLALIRTWLLTVWAPPSFPGLTLSTTRAAINAGYVDNKIFTINGDKVLSDLIATPTLPSGTVPLTAHTANVLQGPADIEFQKDSTVYWLVKVTNPGVHKLLVSNIISPKPIYMQVDVFEHSKYMSKSYLTTSGGQEAFSLSLTDSTEYLIRLSVGDTSQIPNQSTLINFNVQLN